MIIELAKFILVGTRITYQATGDAGMYIYNGTFFPRKNTKRFSCGPGSFLALSPPGMGGRRKCGPRAAYEVFFSREKYKTFRLWFPRSYVARALGVPSCEIWM